MSRPPGGSVVHRAAGQSASPNQFVSLRQRRFVPFFWSPILWQQINLEFLRR